MARFRDEYMGHTLCEAVRNNDAKLVEELVELGVHQCYLDQALMGAAMRHPHLVLIMASQGVADHTVAPLNPIPALCEVCRNAPDIGWELYQIGAGDPSSYTDPHHRVHLIEAAARISHNALDILFAQGVDVDSSYDINMSRFDHYDKPESYTALLDCCFDSQRGVKALIEHGADVNHFGLSTLTPLYIASLRTPVSPIISCSAAAG